MAKCFVVMPVSTPDSWVQSYNNDKDHFNHVLDHLFTPALKSLNYEVVPPTAYGSDLIHAEIIKNLEECELVLCDISTSNPNVFFELGIRTSLDRPVILVRDNLTTKIPFDTASINTYTYESALQPWTLDGQVTSLASHIAQAAERSEGRNSLWRYFGLTQRAAPAEIANPTEAKLDLLVDEVSGLTAIIRERGRSDLSRAEAAVDTANKIAEWQRLSGLSESEVPGPVRRTFFTNIDPAEHPTDASWVPLSTLTGAIPSKFDDFIAKVEQILGEVNSRLDGKTYDTTHDYLILTSSGVISSAQAEKIVRAGKESSIKYLLNAVILTA